MAHPGRSSLSPGGKLAPERVEAFLQVRDATFPVREELAESLKTVMTSIDTMEDGGGSFFGILRIIGTGAGTLPKIATFHRIRAEALLDASYSELMNPLELMESMHD